MKFWLSKMPKVMRRVEEISNETVSIEKCQPLSRWSVRPSEMSLWCEQRVAVHVDVRTR